jgi:hypothetical protein
MIWDNINTAKLKLHMQRRQQQASSASAACSNLQAGSPSVHWLSVYCHLRLVTTIFVILCRSQFFLLRPQVPWASSYKFSNSSICLHSTVSFKAISSFTITHFLFKNTSPYLWVSAHFRSMSITFSSPFYNGYFPSSHPLTHKTSKYQFQIFSYFLTKSIILKASTLLLFYFEQSVYRSVGRSVGLHYEMQAKRFIH